MKKNVIITVMMFGAMVFAMSSFVGSKSSNENSSIELEKALETKTQEVTFKKGKLIEVAFLSVKEGMGKQLKEDYFPKVMPIVKEYGGKSLMKIGVKNNYSKEIKAQMIVFFEWPSAEKKEAFEKDIN